MRASDHSKGIIVSLLGVLILSPDALLIRLAGLGDFTLMFYRGLFPAIAITILLLFYYRRRFLGVVLAIGWAGLVNSVLYATTSITFINSIQSTSVANTLIILSSAPIFAAILSLPILRESQRPSTWLVIGLSFVSIFIIGLGSYGQSSLSGDLFALACAFTTACSAVLVRYKKDIDLVPSVILGSILMALYAMFQSPELAVNSTQFVYIAIIGFVLVPFAFTAIAIAPRFTSSAEVQLVFLLEAILGPLWVWLVIQETPSTNTLIGGGMLLASVSWFAISALKDK
ncbi:MAG: DMT family transporter [Gammaproteobacteria bacterium]